MTHIIVHILHIGVQLCQYKLITFILQSRSLREYPNEDAGNEFDYSDEIIRAKYEKEARIYARKMGETLNLGLARLPVMAHTDKY